MKYKNRTIRNPLYVYLRPHRCLKCGSFTRVDKIRKVIRTNSKEFKAYAYKFFDSYPVGEVEFIEDGFVCNKCDFQIPITTYFRLEKMLNDMERKENYNEEDKNIFYLYEEGLHYAFLKNWSCKKCNTKMSLRYEKIRKLSEYEKFFCSFIQPCNNSTAEYRKIFFMCRECDDKFNLNEIEENNNVIKWKIRKSVLRVIDIVLICIIILIFYLIKK